MNEEIKELERQVRVLTKKLQISEKNGEQLKRERSIALDKYYDLKTQKNCEFCDETQSQYNKIRSAFDRKKTERQAIIRYLNQKKIQINGKLLSISKMIREGKILN